MRKKGFTVGEKSSADQTIKRLCEKVGVKNDSQLANFFGVHQSTVITWRKNDFVPEKYEAIADKFIADLKIGTEAICRIAIIPSDVAEALEITPRAVSTMRSSNPAKYKLIKLALQLRKALLLSSQNQ